MKIPRTQACFAISCIAATQAFGGVWDTDFNLLNSDRGNSSDPIRFNRADPANESGTLHVQIGDDGESDDLFDVGYVHWDGGSWVSNLKLRANGNAIIRNKLGIGVEPTAALDVNGMGVLRDGLSFYSPIMDNDLGYYLKRYTHNGNDQLVMHIGVNNPNVRKSGIFSIMTGDLGTGSTISPEKNSVFSVDQEGTATARNFNASIGISSQSLTGNLLTVAGNQNPALAFVGATADPATLRRYEGGTATEIQFEVGDGVGNDGVSFGRNSSGGYQYGVMIFSDGRVVSNGKITAKGGAQVVGTLTSGAITSAGSISAASVASNGAVTAKGQIISETDLVAKGSVLVGTAGWSITAPDYVFSESYKLREIDSVVAFAKEKKHLPEMPSAMELEKAGQVDLVGMNLLLLKKVEELTLYVGILNDKIKALEEGRKSTVGK